jgi:hypothetical protein
MKVTENRPTPGEEKFWDLAEPLLGRTDVTRSTMMGFPCLRVRGQFFASTDRGSGALVVKLPEARVDELVDAGRAESFAPAGRRFREWASIPFERSRTWKRLLDEALAFVDALPPAKARKKR